MPESVTGFDFLTTVTESRKIPIDKEVDSGKAIATPHIFTEEIPESQTPYINPNLEEGKVGVETFLIFHSKVFIIDRPFETCPRCRKAMEMDELQLDDHEEEYECPHTHAAVYTKLMNEVYSGEAIVQSREFYTSMEGVRRVHVEWAVADEKRLEAEKRKAKKKAEMQVYPANPEAAFKKPLPKEGE